MRSSALRQLKALNEKLDRQVYLQLVTSQISTSLPSTGDIGMAILVPFHDEWIYLAVNEYLANKLNGKPISEHIGYSVRQVLGPANSMVVRSLLRQAFEGAPPVDTTVKLDHGEYVVTYEPILHIRTGQPVAVAASVREGGGSG